jgi:hypothetical protein
MKSIRHGNLDEKIRISFWVFQTPFFEVINQLKRSYSGSSVFANVFNEIQNRLKKDPLDQKVCH